MLGWILRRLLAKMRTSAARSARNYTSTTAADKNLVGVREIRISPAPRLFRRMCWCSHQQLCLYRKEGQCIGCVCELRKFCIVKDKKSNEIFHYYSYL